jgi:hypothetical protein
MESAMKKMSNEQKIIQVLSASSGLKSSEIGKRVKMPIKSLYSTVYKLTKRGVVHREKGGALYLAGVAPTPKDGGTVITKVKEDKQYPALLKEISELRKENEALLESYQAVSIQLFDTRAVVAYLETKLKEAYGNTGKQG